MKRYLLTLSLLATAVLAVNAQLRSEREMQAIAAQHLYGAQARGYAASATAKPTKLMSTDMAAVYADGWSGTVVVSRDARFAPVLGWTDAPLVGTDLPDGLLWWLETVSATMQQKVADNSLNTINTALPAAVEPLVTTRWAQDSPYNDKCPVADVWSGRRAQTGCVATAMAQIMNYHEYPAKGKGTGYYTINNGSKKNQRIDSTYDWANMKDTYSTSGSKKDESTEAVSTLMNDCGVASGMAYAAQMSGATTINAAAGMVNNFSYDDAALHCSYRTFANDAQWLETIYTELQHQRPVLYASTDATYGAHAFVVDGCRAQDGYLHVNWGWSGDANGYFDFFNLNPQTAYQQAYAQQGYDFSKDVASQSMLTGITAPGKEQFAYEAYWCMNDEERITVAGDSITLHLPTLINYHFLEFRGLVGLAIESVATGKAPIQPFYYTAWESSPVPSLSGWEAQDIEYFKSVTDDLDDGDYNLFLVAWHEKAIGKTMPQYIRFTARNDGKENYNVWRMTKKNGHLSISKQDVPVESAIAAPAAAPAAASAAYDLQGRPASAASKGLYIKNGKKYFGR